MSSRALIQAGEFIPLGGGLGVFLTHMLEGTGGGEGVGGFRQAAIFRGFHMALSHRSKVSEGDG